MKGQIKASLFYIAIMILGMIFGALLSCARPSNKVNMRVPYNPLCKDIPLQNNNNVKVNVYKDWAEDSTMTQGKIETLNELFVR